MPAETLTEPVNVLFAPKVVVPTPVWDKDTPLKAPELFGVPPIGAFKDTGVVLLRTKLGLLSVPLPVMEPALITTELTALLAVISKVPPFITTLPATTAPLIELLIVLAAPISSIPLFTVVVPVYVLAPSNVVLADPLSVTPPVPARITLTVKLEVFAKLNPLEAFNCPPVPLIAPP